MLSNYKAKIIVGLGICHMCALSAAAHELGHGDAQGYDQSLLIAQEPEHDQEMFPGDNQFRQRPPGPGKEQSTDGFPDGSTFPNRRNQFRQRPPGLGGGEFMDGPRGRMPFGQRFTGGGAMPLNLSVLDLSEEQKRKIQELRTKDSAKAREIRQALKEKRMQLRSLMFDPKVSDEEIRAKRKEMRKLMDQVEDVMLDDFLSIRSILTPEQRKRLPELRPGQHQGQRMLPPQNGQSEEGGKRSGL